MELVYTYLLHLGHLCGQDLSFMIQNTPIQVRFAEYLVEDLVINCRLSFNAIGKSEFQNCVHRFNPNLDVPSCQYLAYKILPQIAKKETAVPYLFLKVHNIALTLDI